MWGTPTEKGRRKNRAMIKKRKEIRVSCKQEKGVAVARSCNSKEKKKKQRGRGRVRERDLAELEQVTFDVRDGSVEMFEERGRKLAKRDLCEATRGSVDRTHKKKKQGATLDPRP